MRELICRLFNLVPAEQVPLKESWDVLIEARNANPVWPRILGSRVWTEDLQPWLEQMLVQTLFRLANERDPKVVLELQIQAQMLNRFLETPVKEKLRGDLILDNQFRANGEVPIGGR